LVRKLANSLEGSYSTMVAMSVRLRFNAFVVQRFNLYTCSRVRFMYLHSTVYMIKFHLTCGV